MYPKAWGEFPLSASRVASSVVTRNQPMKRMLWPVFIGCVRGARYQRYCNIILSLFYV